MAKMKDDELEALLAIQQRTAVGALNSTIGRHRASLIDRYNGEPYGDEVEDRSKIVDTTVRDTVESIKPELMDIFFGGDKAVQFAPRGPEDVDAAEQETDTCNYVFLQQNDGFMVAYNWFTDALFQKTGYVKRYWDERKRVEVEEYDELTPQEAATLLEELDETSDEVEILERSGGIDEETGAVEPLYLKIRRTSTEKRYVVENVPPEEVLVTAQWHKVDFRGCPFVSHKRKCSISDLVEMDFDRKQLEELKDYDEALETEEAENRFDGEYWSESDSNSTDTSMREVLVYENYIRCDRDGDGIAEQLRIFTTDQGKVLKRGGKKAIEEVTDAPFEVLCALPIPHKHYGLCPAELVMDLARIKTVLTRQLLDNVVAANNPDLVVDDEMMTPNTVEDLKATGLGRIIRVIGGPASLQSLQYPQMAGESLSAIQYIDELTERRTGVTKVGQGLDPDAINKNTATGAKMLMSAGQKKILMIARIFAETGFKSLFLNMHRDLRAGPLKSITVRLSENPVTVNPRIWKHRADMVVNVGLGTGDRDVQFARLSQILLEQKEGLMMGAVGYKHVHHTYSKLLELAGYKDTGNFFPTPEEVEEAQKNAPPKEPDPATLIAQAEVAKVQAQAQVESNKIQLEAYKSRQKDTELELKKLDLMMKDDRERDLTAAKIEMEEAKWKNGSVDGKALTAK